MSRHWCDGPVTEVLGVDNYPIPRLYWWQIHHDRWRNSLLVFVNDNSGVVLSLNAGRAFDPRARRMLKDIADASIEWNIDHVARWVDRARNYVADGLSRQLSWRQALAWAERHRAPRLGGSPRAPGDTHDDPSSMGNQVREDNAPPTATAPRPASAGGSTGTRPRCRHSASTTAPQFARNLCPVLPTPDSLRPVEAG